MNAKQRRVVKRAGGEPVRPLGHWGMVARPASVGHRALYLLTLTTWGAWTVYRRAWTPAEILPGTAAVVGDRRRADEILARTGWEYVVVPAGLIQHTTTVQVVTGIENSLHRAAIRRALARGCRLILCTYQDFNGAVDCRVAL